MYLMKDKKMASTETNHTEMNSKENNLMDLGSKIITASDLLTITFPQQQWLVEDWIPEGLTLLAGRPKIGKSLMALDLGVSISTSGYFLNRECLCRRVLYFPLEDHPRRIQERLRRFSDKPMENLCFCFDSEYKGRGFQVLQKKIHESKAEVVIIDTLSRFLLGVDQNDHVQMVDIFGGLNNLTQSENISIIMVDHHRKSQFGTQTDPIEDIFGSTGKTSQVDTCIGLYKNGCDKHHTLMIRSRDQMDNELKIHRSSRDLRWKLVDDPNNIQPGSRKDKILTAMVKLTYHEVDATVTSISELTNIEKSNVSHDLSDLCLREIIIKGEKKGKEQPYLLTDKEVNKTIE